MPELGLTRQDQEEVTSKDGEKHDIDELDWPNESPFYPDICLNRLYFHGTPNKEKLESILTAGLQRPKNGGESNLIRDIYFTSAARYSGGYGFMIGFKPELEEIDISKSSPQFVVETNLSSPTLPPERAILYVPGNSDIPHLIYEQVNQVIDQYLSNQIDQNGLLKFLTALVTIVEQKLATQATFLVEFNPDSIHKLAQEMVWNRIGAKNTYQVSYLETYAQELMKIKDQIPINSMSDLMAVLQRKSFFAEFKPEDYLRTYKFINNLQNIKGLGYENYPMQSSDLVDDIVQWLTELGQTVESQPETLPPAPQIFIEKAIRLFRGRK